MSDYVTPAGLAIPTVESLLADLAADQKANVDPLINTEPDSPQGNINGVFASQLREAWEVLEIAYDGFNPDAAEGKGLENVSAITGTNRATATKSRFTGSRKVSINLDAAKTCPVGTVFSVAGSPSNRFVTTESVTSVLAGAYLIACENEQTGPIACNAGTLTVIATPVVGLNSVTNPFDAILGTNADTDPQLRIRRENELRATGAGTVDSLRSDLLAYTADDGSKPILQCTIFENSTDVADANGLPPHSLEALVFDGVGLDVANNQIAQLIWDSKPGGIQMVGISSGTATDTLSSPQIVKFTRPTIIVNKFTISIWIKASRYVGDTAFKSALVTEYNKIAKQGGVIRVLDLIAALIETTNGTGQLGVVDFVNFQIGLDGGAFNANLVNYQLGVREMGTTDTSKITLFTVAI